MAGVGPVEQSRGTMKTTTHDTDRHNSKNWHNPKNWSGVKRCDDFTSHRAPSASDAWIALVALLAQAERDHCVLGSAGSYRIASAAGVQHIKELYEVEVAYAERDGAAAVADQLRAVVGACNAALCTFNAGAGSTG